MIHGTLAPNQKVNAYTKQPTAHDLIITKRTLWYTNTSYINFGSALIFLEFLAKAYEDNI